MRRTIRAVEAEEKVDEFTECWGCNRSVDREKCFADLLTKDGKTIWICYCGELIPDQKTVPE